MSVNGKIDRLIKEAQNAEQKGKFSEAASHVKNALSYIREDDEQRKKIEDYLFDLNSSENKRNILNALRQNDLSFAKTLYEENKGSFNDKDEYEINKEIKYSEYLELAISTKVDDLDQAAEHCQKAMELYPDRDNSQKLFRQICDEKEAQVTEDKMHGIQPIMKFGIFNVPKKENEGEDADPICNVDANLNWGVIATFDGMGGAGAKKYKHISTGTEHTSAYWGSRAVKECVEDLIQKRPKGNCPTQWVIQNLHECIKNKLNDAILEFSNANGSVLSKMTRKLPTTMAMSIYEIKEDNVKITTLWAGDSRVYLLLRDTIEILTIDDANAEDGDPFSPINTDLAMNNAISQDREFRINKSFKAIPISSNTPFLLISTTDGCFGYYKNPLEFEAMLRTSLSNANNENEYLENIKQSIIENIQQDDFSISIVGFGDSDFRHYKSILSSEKDCELITKYYDWRHNIESQETDIKKRISNLETQLVECREEIERLHSTEEQENLNWYAKYKENFSVVKREDIESI